MTFRHPLVRCRAGVRAAARGMGHCSCRWRRKSACGGSRINDLRGDRFGDAPDSDRFFAFLNLEFSDARFFNQFDQFLYLAYVHSDLFPEKAGESTVKSLQR
jgi:hypothetical protein